MTFKAPQAVRYLKSHWKHLDALTQGELVSKLTDGAAGVSRRALAREVGCSESNLRYVEKISKLPDSAKADIRGKKISVRAAMAHSHLAHVAPSPQNVVTVRPVSQASVAPAQPQVEYVAPEQPDAKGWAELMVRFTLNEYGPQRDACARVIREARFVSREIPCLRLGTHRIPFGASPTYIIENSRPLRRADAFNDVSSWLAVWVLRLIPDKKVRAEAFNIAERLLMSPQR
jgi:hypothetical protein